MARQRRSTALHVHMNGKYVGVYKRAANGAISFDYADEWRSWDFAMPISLSMPIRGRAYTGDTVTNFFDGLLPDNDEVRERIAAREGANGVDAYSLLSEIGRDCVGALQFLPTDATAAAPASPIGTALTEADIAQTIRDLRVAPLGRDDSDDFRISIAGFQDKTALLWQDEKWKKPLGPSPTTHILKPPIRAQREDMDFSHSIENEHFCMRLMAEFGISTAPTEILHFEDQKVIAVTRFDRRWRSDGSIVRIPQEDICQALGYPSSKKYQSDGGPDIKEITKFLRGSALHEADPANFFHACILFWLIGATDGHAKNFSIQHQPNEEFRLAPLYDIMSLQPNVDAGQVKWNKYKLSMSFGNSRTYKVNDIVGRHIEETAIACGIRERVVGQIAEEIADNLENAFDRTMDLMPSDFPEGLHDSIREGARKRLPALISILSKPQ